MPVNFQALLLLLVFIVPGFVFVEVDTRRRPAQKLGTFDKTVLSIFFSTILHAVLTWLILLALLTYGFDTAKLLDRGWLAGQAETHIVATYALGSCYFILSVGIASVCGFMVGRLTHRWTPVLSRVVKRDRDINNWVLVQMSNGDFFTGILGMIPADYDVLTGPAKDFAVIPPGRYKAAGQPWQPLQDGEVVLLNTSNVDAIRIIQSLGQSVNDSPPAAEPPG